MDDGSLPEGGRRLAHGRRGAAAAARQNSNKSAVRCSSQQAPCNKGFIPSCGGNDACIAAIRRCCSFVGSCNIGRFFTCLESI